MKKAALVVSIFIFFLVLIIMELLVAVFSPQQLYDGRNPLHPDHITLVEPHCVLGWYNKPGLVSESYDPKGALWQSRHNSAGFRGDEFSLDSGKRILVFGDSQAYGMYLSERETIPSRLASGLQDADVLNLGVIGYSTDQEYILYQAVSDNLNHDVVVLLFYVNDLNGNLQRVQHGIQRPYYRFRNATLKLFKAPVCNESPARNHSYTGIDRFLRSWSHLYNWAVNLRKVTKPIPYHDVFDQNTYYLQKEKGLYYDETMNISLSLIKAFKELAEENSACFILVNLPSKVAVLEDFRDAYFERYADRSEEDFNFTLVDSVLTDFSDDARIIFVDANSLVASDDAKSSYFLSDDDHLSSQGAKKVAELVQPYVEQCLSRNI